MDEKKALEFINRIIEECYPDARDSVPDSSRRQRAMNILKQLYEIMKQQNVSARTLELAEISISEFNYVLEEYRSRPSCSLSAENIREARRRAIHDREMEARYRGRC